MHMDLFFISTDVFAVFLPSLKNTALYLLILRYYLLCQEVQ